MFLSNKLLIVLSSFTFFVCEIEIAKSELFSTSFLVNVVLGNVRSKKRYLYLSSLMKKKMKIKRKKSSLSQKATRPNFNLYNKCIHSFLNSFYLYQCLYILRDQKILIRSCNIQLVFSQEFSLPTLKLFIYARFFTTTAKEEISRQMKKIPTKIQIATKKMKMTKKEQIGRQYFLKIIDFLPNLLFVQHGQFPCLQPVVMVVL